jgi:hypothetical protein
MDIIKSMDIIKGLSTAADVLKKAHKIPEYQQILDAMERLTTQQGRISELEIENRNLKEKLKTREELIVKNDAYWKKNGDGPFCLTCHGSKDLLIRMVSWGAGQHKCNNCNNVVETDPVQYQNKVRAQEAEIERNNSLNNCI